MASVEANKAKVQENKEKLYNLERVVVGNKQKIYAARAFIEENRGMITCNYAAAFMGNRQMVNFHTDDVFKNRTAILEALPTGDAVKENFQNSKLNEAKIDYLEHRASMNSKAAAVSAKMVEANALLIEINEAIMKGNSEIVDFNKGHSEINTKLLEGTLTLEEATPEKNAERIASNGKRVADITEVASGNTSKAETALASSKANREKIEKNKEMIYARRADIEEMLKKTAENAAKIEANKK